MAEVAALRKCNFGGSGRALGSAVAARRWRRKRFVGGGSGGSAAGSAAAAGEGSDVLYYSHVLKIFLPIFVSPFFSVSLQDLNNLIGYNN